ncbi:MAG: Ig-like domain-containing protein, partial [Burkholderiaceae bacterium]|nr:Ig-like domain-containing protein [Burkholderiaceae bacterium]
GGAGDDTLAGGGGNDIAVYTGRAAEYAVSPGAAGSYIVTDSVKGRDGGDSLSGIESLRFSDGARAPGSLAGTDRSAPTVKSFNPADGASGVAPDANLVFVFSEPIARGAGAITIKTAGGALFDSYNSASSANISISGGTLTINPSANLASATGYVVEFGAGALKDLAGNGYAGGKDYNFTTATAAKPTVTLTAAQSSINEGNAGTKLVTFTAKLSAAATAPLSVTFASADGSARAGSDYTAASGSLVFAAGSTSKTFTVAVRGDTAVEGNENFYVSLTGATGATLGKDAAVRASVSINNDDAAKAALMIAGAVPQTHAQATSADAALSAGPQPLAHEPAALLVGTPRNGVEDITQA